MKGKRVLIINRGEIAIRVAKALNELGLISVGVWTDNETEPPHLEFCQEWVRLEGFNNKDTYLNIPRIMKLIDDYKIDGVHPVRSPHATGSERREHFPGSRNNFPGVS